MYHLHRLVSPMKSEKEEMIRRQDISRIWTS